MSARPYEFSAEQRRTFGETLYAGKKIEAIKHLREISGLGLADAKDVIERLESELRAAHPERFSTAPAKSGGCFALLCCLVVTSVLIILLRR